MTCNTTDIQPYCTASALYQRALVYFDLGRIVEARSDIRVAVRVIGSDAAVIEASEVLLHSPGPGDLVHMPDPTCI